MFNRIRKDIQAALERDPAARSSIEVLLCYPGLHALILHRIAHSLWHAGLHLIARLLSQYARFVTGIEIHPGATIGEGVFIDHGMGVVIGETAVVGDGCTLYQGVTLGGTGKERGKRHPTLGNNVVAGAGAKILGNITIGDGAAVGAGAVVLKPVPPNATAVGVPATVTGAEGRPVAATLEHGRLPDPMAEFCDAMNKRVSKLEAALERAQAQPGGEEA